MDKNYFALKNIRNLSPEKRLKAINKVFEGSPDFLHSLAGDGALPLAVADGMIENVIGRFASDADALVASHAIAEVSRGALRDAFALPSELGKVAATADARMLILAHRTNRTRGRESLSRAAIEKTYSGSVLFANDGECWGL